MKTLAERSLRVALIGYVPADDPHVIADMQAEIDRLLDALQRSHKELLQYAWYEQGLTGLRTRNENALRGASAQTQAEEKS